MTNHFIKTVFLYSLSIILLLGSIVQPIFAGAGETDMPAILRKLENKDAKIRENAMWKLAEIDFNKLPDPNRDEAVAGLKKLLNDPVKSIRYYTAGNLQWMKYTRQEGVSVLIDALKEKDGLDGGFIYALGQFGPDAADAVPAIIEAMKRRPEDHSWETSCVLALENIATPKALEAVKPYKQKWERQLKLVKPIRILRDNIFGSALMTFGLLGLFWWSWRRRKKGDRIICWPLLIPVPFWGLFVYDAFWLRAHPGPIITIWEAEFHFSIAIFIITLSGIIPWLVSLLQWRKSHAAPSVPTP
jgi:hypothetical protein